MLKARQARAGREGQQWAHGARVERERAGLAEDAGEAAHGMRAGILWPPVAAGALLRIVDMVSVMWEATEGMYA